MKYNLDVMLKILSFLYFKLFCSPFWHLSKLKMQFRDNQSLCIVCNGNLDLSNVAKIDIAGYVSLIDSSPIASFFYRLKFLSYMPKLRQKILNYKYFITSNSDLLSYKKCLKCESLNLVLKKNRSSKVGDDDINYFSKPKDINKKENIYILRFADFISKTLRDANLQDGNVLDVGSGNGELVSLLQKKNINVEGIEPSIGQFKSSIKDLNIKAKNQYYSKEEYEKGSFSFIFSYHSIEHFEHFDEFFIAANFHLLDHGVLCVSTPTSELATQYAEDSHSRYFSSATEVLFCSSHDKILSKKIILQKAKEYGFSPKRIIENGTSQISEDGEKPAGCTFIFEKSRPMKTHHL